MIFVKQLPSGWALEKRAHETIECPEGKGCYYDTHLLIHQTRGITHDFPDWEWADFDDDQLLWVEKGVLYKSRVTLEGVEGATELFDFNPMQFEAIPAPY
ncbi:MAG: hypothetical protein ACFBZ8_12850 [Opitutales bacterium]